MHRMKSIFEGAATPVDYIRAYFARLTEVMQALDPEQVGRCIDALEQTYENGRTIFLCANGGSSAVAAHFVNDAVFGMQAEGAKPVRALSLTDNAETITAIANDRGFENIFTGQLQTLMEAGDLVIAMSVSGNSVNLVKALEYASANGARTMAWTGFDGGKLARMADLAIHMPGTPDEYGPCEDMFSILEHAVTTYLAMKRGRQLHH